MGQVVDSSVFVRLERSGRGPEDLRTILAGEPFAISAITASELLTGIYFAESAERRSRREEFVEAMLEDVEILPVDLNVARVHAELWAHLSTAGQMTGAHDLLIAATALAHGDGVLTDNVRDFDRVPGLEVRQPDW